VSALASVATLVIVAVGSYAALRQIEHLRRGTRVEIALRLFEQWQSPRVRDSFVFIRNELHEKLASPVVRASVLGGALDPEIDAALPVANFYENIGDLITKGELDPALIADTFPTLLVWEKCAPLIALMRVRHPYALELFEYTAVLQRDLDAKRGTAVAYPKGVARMPLPAVDDVG